MLCCVCQIEKLLTQLMSAIYPVMHESSSRLLMELNLVVRDVPSQHLFSIVKSYLQNSDELSQKKRFDLYHCVNQ